MTQRKRQESGFALLLVFCMAAAVGLLLYLEMPRVAFESQRLREDLLIDRGSEYKRAIKYYFRENKKFPASIDDLEKGANNKRFLRHRYRDPMTGKDDWRIIHIGPNGEFTDSITQKTKGPLDEKKGNSNTFITEMPSIGSTGNEGAATNTVAGRVRESDKRSLIPGQEVPDPSNQSAYYRSNSPTEQPALVVGPQPGQNPPDPNAWQPGRPQPVDSMPGGQPQVQSGQPGQQPPVGFPVGQPGQQPPVGFPAMQPGQQPPVGFPVAQPGQQPPVGLPVAQPGQQQPVGFPVAQPGQQPPVGFPIAQPGAVNPADPANRLFRGFQGQLPPQPVGTANSQQFQQQQFNQFNQQQFNQQSGNTNPAVQQVWNQITNPNRNGPPSSALPTTGIGAGIAGVASKFEAEGIKVYNEKSKYNEWEFLYDMKKEAAGAGKGGETDPNRPYFNPLGPKPPQPPNRPLGQ
jgi:hypothetical protein